MARDYRTTGPAGSGSRDRALPPGRGMGPGYKPGEKRPSLLPPGAGRATISTGPRKRPTRGTVPPPGGGSRTTGSGAGGNRGTTPPPGSSETRAGGGRPPGSGATASSAPRVARGQKRTLAAAFPSKKKLSQYMEEAFADSKAAGKQKSGNWYKRAYAMWMKDVRATEQAKKGSSSRR